MDPIQQLSALELIMREWNHFPKAFCIKKILGWSDDEISLFLKLYNKEKKKRDKDLKTTLLTAAQENKASRYCDGGQCCG